MYIDFMNKNTYVDIYFGHSRIYTTNSGNQNLPSPACRRTQDSVFVRILPQNLGLKSSNMGMSGTPKSEGVFRGRWEIPGWSG